MLGTKIYKEYVENNYGGLSYETYDEELYVKCAIWCNESGTATIQDKGEYYEVVEIPVYVETAEEIQKRLTDGVQKWMDAKVQERNYDSVHTCVGTYLYSPIEKFRLEAEAVRDWVSYVWAKCYAILAEVEEGVRAIPTLEEVIAELPQLEWPV